MLFGPDFCDNMSMGSILIFASVAQPAASSAVWFCGTEPTWKFFAAPLLPLRCYFSATLKRSELEDVGVTVYAKEAECDCIPSPPAPASPPRPSVAPVVAAPASPAVASVLDAALPAPPLSPTQPTSF